MKKRFFAGAVLMALSGQIAAQEHPACQQLALTSQRYNLEELLTISRSCRSPDVAELYLNRAYHQRMLQKYERFERSLLHYGDGDSKAYIEAYRIHIGLAEAFASHRLNRLDSSVVAQLNRLYDESSEIAEMRFRGYDKVADRLEQKRRL